MLEHQRSESEEIPIDQYRVSAAELATAIAQLEEQKLKAAQPAQDETITLGQAIQELDIEATPQEVWQEVQAMRRTADLKLSTRHRTRLIRRRVAMAGLAATMIGALTVGPIWYAQAIHSADLANIPLLQAVYVRDAKRVQSLLTQGMNPNARSYASPSALKALIDPLQGRISALSLAVRNADPATVRVLVDAGAQANVRDEFRATALHQLAGVSKWTPDHTQVLRLLLQNGADLNIRNYRGVSPIDYARKGHNKAFLDACRALGHPENRGGTGS